MVEDQQQLGDRDRFSPCEWCGEPFRPPKPTGRRPKHCRPACRQAAYKARRDKRVGDEAVITYVMGRASDGQPAVQAGPELKGAVSPPLF